MKDDVSRNASDNSSDKQTTAFDRRAFVGCGILLLTGAMVGCQSGGTSRLPGPAWPRGDAPPVAPPVTASRPYVPPPTSPQPLARVAGVMPRSSWTSASPVLSLSNPMNGVNRITVHHDAINSLSLRTQSDMIRRLESIRQSHRRQNWADIGYHYVIDPTGRVWEGRPLSLQGAHVSDCNEHNIGVMVMGNFDQQTPSSSATSTLDEFVRELMRTYRVPISRVYTHQEFKPTACPGRNLQRYMLQTRSRNGRLYQA